MPALMGLGAILPQQRSDDKLCPVADANRSTSFVEKWHNVMELETLAVVWTVQHFRAYLYEYSVTVITNHLTIKSNLIQMESICDGG